LGWVKKVWGEWALQVQLWLPLGERKVARESLTVKHSQREDGVGGGTGLVVSNRVNGKKKRGRSVQHLAFLRYQWPERAAGKRSGRK